LKADFFRFDPLDHLLQEVQSNFVLGFWDGKGKLSELQRGFCIGDVL
jgi:hypothetical protein